MSMDAAVAFYERLGQEPGLQERIKELNAPELIEPYVRDELGYRFTKEEMQRVIFERNPEMSDEEMEAVTGGTIVMVAVYLVGYLAIAATAAA